LDGVWTNREVTGLEEVPRRMLVLGGGPVGVEMAQAVRRMGAEVALVEGADHVLPREPAPLGEALGEALSADGIELMFGEHATAARYAAVPRVVFTDPQAASVGEAEGLKTARVELSGVARTSTYTRAYDKKPGFLTLVSDGERLTGAYALGPEAGEWLGQATLA